MVWLQAWASAQTDHPGVGPGSGFLMRVSMECLKVEFSGESTARVLPEMPYLAFNRLQTESEMVRGERRRIVESMPERNSRSAEAFGW